MSSKSPAACKARVEELDIGTITGFAANDFGSASSFNNLVDSLAFDFPFPDVATTFLRDAAHPSFSVSYAAIAIEEGIRLASGNR
jgi:hypothetical protein